MENLRVCSHCLLAIESRMGVQPVNEIPVDEDDPDAICGWCEQSAADGGFDILYELVP